MQQGCFDIPVFGTPGKVNVRTAIFMNPYNFRAQRLFEYDFPRYLLRGETSHVVMSEPFP